MERAVDGLEHQFKKLSTDLHYVAHRLENAFPASSTSASNPVSLCKRLRTLQAELVGLRREATTLTEAKQRAVLDTTRLLVANVQILQKLRVSTGAVGAVDGAEEGAEDGAAAALADVLELQRAHAAANAGSTTSCFGLSFQQSDASAALISAGTDKTSAEARSSKRNPPSTASEADASAAPRAATSASASTAPAPAASAPASPASSHSTVSTRSFESVPRSVRGRCKLADLNKTLDIVRKFARGEVEPSENAAPNGRPKSAAAQQLSELTALGAKVSGYTGKCILGTLRALKYITISPSGGIKLLE
jgi:hypothetical protein